MRDAGGDGDGGRARARRKANDADGGLVALSGIVIGRADLRPLLA